jgi:hypothetical protein
MISLDEDIQTPDSCFRHLQKQKMYGSVYHEGKGKVQ